MSNTVFFRCLYSRLDGTCHATDLAFFLDITVKLLTTKKADEDLSITLNVLRITKLPHS